MSGCRGITALPEGLRISSWLDVAGSGLTELPPGQNIPLRGRGVRVDARVAFRPGTLMGAQVLNRDAGGERTLVRVALAGDEPFVAVSVACSSTGRQYVLRVPPTVETAHAASAWLAVFDDPRRYRPAVEA